MNKTLKSLAWIGAGAAALAAANTAIFANADALGNVLEGEGRFWRGPDGDAFYARQGKGEPVVLLHGIYAGASNYEWRRNFDALSEHFNVYAPDWLGFGLSDKPRIRYTSETYLNQLREFLVSAVQEPCWIIASSLAAAYAVRIASEMPERVLGLLLVCPTGLGELSSSNSAKEAVAYEILHSPLLGTTIYNGIASAASLRWYLMNQTYFDPSLADDEMIAHFSAATHQYGSQNAPPSFISGLLNHDISDAFPQLQQQTIRIAWGREAKMSPLANAEAFLAANPHAELTVFDKCGILPHDEQAQAFNRLAIASIRGKDAPPKRARAKRQKAEAAEPMPEGDEPDVPAT